MIAIVPMKEISERLPSKNLRVLNGQPLFFWTLKALRFAKKVDKIILTTDSELIAELATKNIPDVIVHFRPAELIGNDITANALIKDVLDNYFPEEKNFLFTHVTNPLVKSDTYDIAIDAFEMLNTFDSLLGVTKHQFRLYNRKGEAINHDPRVILPTQLLEPLYEDNSCMYIFSRGTFEKFGRVGEHPFFFEMKKTESIDIDTLEDFELAERIMQTNEY